jgi:hypothetical protein
MPGMSQVTSQGWVQTVTAFAPFAAALTALFVGWLQWRVQKLHFKQNVYEKRYAIYDAARTYLAEAMRKNGKDDITAYLQFRAATDPAEFLFPASVYAYLKKIAVLGQNFCASQGTLEDCRQRLPPARILSEPDREELAKAMRDMQGSREAIVAELEGGLKSVFYPHLRLEDGRSWFDKIEDALNVSVKLADEKLAERYKT